MRIWNRTFFVKILWGLALAAFTPAFASAGPGLSVSKSSGYTVIAPDQGVSVPKASGNTVIAPVPGVSVPKASGYTILSPTQGLAVAKAAAYAVIQPVVQSQQPNVFIITKQNSSSPAAQSSILNHLFPTLAGQ